MRNVLSLSDEQLLSIEQKFKDRQEFASERADKLFSVMNENLSKEEEILLKILFAYMPSHDLADYDGEVFLKHVRDTLEIRNKVEWGKSVPDDIFIGFVLPYRESNEMVDGHRLILFNSLYERTKGMSMFEAVDQVIHWYNENSTYIPSDPRTLSPLGTLTASRGRCGEGSTLISAALRSIGIPARQCYTPLWAHCDSNHAWVEAWADGDWCLFGDNRPEKKLSNGFFRSPAIRAMLVNSRAIGIYSGQEEVVKEHSCYKIINILGNYAPRKRIVIKVTDEQKKPVSGATVCFQLYNYAGIDNIAAITADENGNAYLTAGYGDLVIHAYAKNEWGFKKISVKDGDNFEVAISDHNPLDEVLEFDMVPPAELPMEEESLSEEELQKSRQCIKDEEKSRAAIEAAYVTRENAEELAKELSLPTEKVWNVLSSARGNSHELYRFLKEIDRDKREWALKLLEAVLPKDLIDTPVSVFEEVLDSALKLKSEYDEETFVKYIMNPRIGFEKLTSFNKYFQDILPAEKQTAFANSPSELVSWIYNNIKVENKYCHYQKMTTPIGSFELKKTDSKSFDILIVAMARSLGVPARLELSDGRPQIFTKDGWVNAISFVSVEEDLPVKAPAYGKLELIKDNSCDEKLEYEIHFSISRFNGTTYDKLDYSDLDLNEGEKTIEIESGNYRLITGNRLPDGTVLTRIVSFTVKPDEITKVIVELRKEELDIPAIERVTSDCTFCTVDGEKKKLDDIVSSKPAIIAWLEPNSETSKHVIRELQATSEELDALDVNILLMVSDDMLTESFNKNSYEGLPAKTYFAVDYSYECLKDFNNGNTTLNFPGVFVIDTNRDIRYVATGYKLGIGKSLVKILKKI